MPTVSKRGRILEEVVGHHVQRKRARTTHTIFQLLDDLSSSDTPEPEPGAPLSERSSSSLSSVSSPSFGPSDPSSSPSRHSHNSHNSRLTHSSQGSYDFETLEAALRERWDAHIQSSVEFLLTTRVLEASPPVEKLGQLGIYLYNYRGKHPGRFRKKLRVTPAVFDRLVELIQDHDIFHNNSNVPQLPVNTQLAIFLVRVGHYGNASSPEDVAQFAGVSVGTVINATYRCLIAFLARHDEAIMMPPEEEKEKAKEYVEKATCPEWRNGFLLADGTKFALFQKPGLHGEAWFDKNKDYSIDCQVCIQSSQFALHTDLYYPGRHYASEFAYR